MDPPDPPVARILELAARLTHADAAALDSVVRSGIPTGKAARQALESHQRWLNSTAMFGHWPDPAIEMSWARQRVYAALGLPDRNHLALEPDDGSVAWGAATAAACAVLVAGRAGAPEWLGTAWRTVIGE